MTNVYNCLDYISHNSQLIKNKVYAYTMMTWCFCSSKYSFYLFHELITLLIKGGCLFYIDQLSLYWVGAWCVFDRLINLLLKSIGMPAIKFNTKATSSFVAMSNVENFTSAAKQYGVPETSLFQTSDLAEGRKGPFLNIINCLNILGKLVSIYICTSLFIYLSKLIVYSPIIVKLLGYSPISKRLVYSPISKLLVYSPIIVKLLGYSSISKRLLSPNGYYLQTASLFTNNTWTARLFTYLQNG